MQDFSGAVQRLPGLQHSEREGEAEAVFAGVVESSQRVCEGNLIHCRWTRGLAHGLGEGARMSPITSGFPS